MVLQDKILICIGHWGKQMQRFLSLIGALAGTDHHAWETSKIEVQSTQTSKMLFKNEETQVFQTSLHIIFQLHIYIFTQTKNHTYQQKKMFVKESPNVIPPHPSNSLTNKRRF